MIGRINAIKMLVLPRFLYLFQNLPVYLPSSFFKQIDSIILSFVWADKPPRIAKSFLQRNMNKGGLGLPVLKHYYWAANTRALIFWQQGFPDNDLSDVIPLWLKIESLTGLGSALPVLLFSGVQSSYKIVGYNFILRKDFEPD